MFGVPGTSTAGSRGPGGRRDRDTFMLSSKERDKIYAMALAQAQADHPLVKLPVFATCHLCDHPISASSKSAYLAASNAHFEFAHASR